MYNLEEIHKISYDFLKEMNDICRKHDINLMLDGGTLLGAVRENDFIPWDDDVDLIIKRSDYDKYINIICEELSDKYEFYPVGSYNGHFFDFISRFVYKEGTLRDATSNDESYCNMQNKVSFDLFILENCPNSDLFASILILKIKIIYGLAMGHRASLKWSNYSMLNKIIIFVLAYIGKGVKLEKIYKMFNKCATRYNEVETKRYFTPGSLLQYINLKYDKEWYDDISEYSIRDVSLKCPKNVDAVLSNIYGPNYMIPPSIENRISKHLE